MLKKRCASEPPAQSLDQTGIRIAEIDEQIEMAKKRKLLLQQNFDWKNNHHQCAENVAHRNVEVCGEAERGNLP